MNKDLMRNDGKFYVCMLLFAVAGVTDLVGGVTLASVYGEVSNVSIALGLTILFPGMIGMAWYSPR